jgi:cytosine/adenosine deaminase-related metal-dependent hydrolase
VIWANAVSLVNARVAAGRDIADSIRFSSRVLSIGERPKHGDTVIDLQGGFVLPGLVNAHDHLELNHYGRLKGRDRYANASDWIADMDPRLSGDPAIRAGRAHPLIERLFVGGLKNLLAGVTTVAHHNPFYPEMRRTVPIRVVRRYGWAHSFLLQTRPAGARGEPGGDVGARWRATPPNAPFLVHLAEGVDDDACGELPRLEALGCLKPNTVIVHGVAIDENGWRRVARAGAGLVWCPASNVFLFGRTALICPLIAGVEEARVTVALGTDSRLTGSLDLLDELRAARRAEPMPAATLLGMVTTAAATLLRQPRIGSLAAGGPADLIVVPPLGDDPGGALLAANRRDLRLVVVDGRPLVGDPDFAAVFAARRVTPRPLRVDGAAKLGDSGLVRRIAGCPIVEPGVAAG